MLSDNEKVILKKLFKDKGFKEFSQGKYVFEMGLKTTVYKKFIEALGIPEVCDYYPGLEDFQLKFFRDKISPRDLEEVVKEYSEENNYKVNYTQKLLAPASPEEEEQKNSKNESVDLDEYIKSLIPVINIRDKDQANPIILLDPVTKRPVSDISSDVWIDIQGTSLKSLRLGKNVPKAMTTFDPYNLEAIFEEYNHEAQIKCLHVNYYIPPAWRFVEGSPRYGGFIKMLIEHLFPIESDREYVLDWLHYAIVSRNETVLCLIGPRGTGKGILLKDILGVLIGEKYREIVNQEILTDKFNSAFKNRRYVFFDEVNVSGDRELNRFKAFCNSHIALEEKGKDSETIDNYTSLALSSNDRKEFKAEPQERRFSVPQITEVPLLKVIPEKDIEAFIKRINEPDSVEIAEFGQFLLSRTPIYSSRTPLKGKYYFDLCRLSMPEWKIFIIDFFINEGEIGVVKKNSELTKLFRKVYGEDLPFATRKGSIETFIMDYFHEGVCRIGKVVDAWDAQRSRSTFGILPSEEFLRQFGKLYQVGSEEETLSGLDAL
jgi:hypothetical protein